MNEIKYTASAFVLNRENKMLLIWHKKFNKYVQPGGHILDDELPYEAAIREVFEETKVVIDIPIKVPFAKEDYYNKVGHQVDYQYIAYAINEDIKNNDESFKAGWFSIDDLDSIDIVEDLKDKFRVVLEHISKEK